MIRLALLAALGIGAAVTAGIPKARADWQECYTRCSLAKQGQCVEHATSCTNHRTGSGESGQASYEAIAFDPAGSAYGYSHGWANRTQAEAEALKQCGQNGCIVATWFFNHCGALATSSNHSWGADQAANEQGAAALAQQRCTQEGGSDCKITVTHCSL